MEEETEDKPEVLNLIRFKKGKPFPLMPKHLLPGCHSESSFLIPNMSYNKIVRCDKTTCNVKEQCFFYGHDVTLV